MVGDLEWRGPAMRLDDPELRTAAFGAEVASTSYLPADPATGGICVRTPRGFSYFSHGVLGMSAYSVVCIGFSAFALFSCNAAFSLLSLNSIFSLLSAGGSGALGH